MLLLHPSELGHDWRRLTAVEVPQTYYSLAQENGTKTRIFFFFLILLVFIKSTKWKDGVYWRREIQD